MYLDSLRYFEEVASANSFTKAAEKLYVSQQNLSQHIKRLEEYYGVQLFYRKPSLQLTYAGKLLRKYAREIFEQEDRLISEFSYVRSQQKGKIALGITPTRAPVFIPRIIPRFNALYPLVDLSLKEAHTAELRQNMLDGDVDLIIGVISPAISADRTVTVIPLMEDRVLYFLCTRGLLLEHGISEERIERARTDGIDFQEITSLPVILKPSESRIHSQIAQTYLKLDKRPYVFMESGNVLSQLPICRDGRVGVFLTRAIVHYVMQQYENMIRDLLILPIRNCSVDSSIVLVYLSGKPTSLYFNGLVDIAKDVFADYALECESTWGCHA